MSANEREMKKKTFNFVKIVYCSLIGDRIGIDLKHVKSHAGISLTNEIKKEKKRRENQK